MPYQNKHIDFVEVVIKEPWWHFGCIKLYPAVTSVMFNRTAHSFNVNSNGICFVSVFDVNKICTLGNLNMMAFYVFFNYVRNQDLKKVQTISVSQDSDQTTND